jgi:hypothetical protein
MNTIAKNLVLMGTSLVFIVFFFVYSEINRAQSLIDLAQDPNGSTVRGFDEAEADYEEGYAYFQSYNGEYLGVSHEDMAAFNDGQSNFVRFICGFGRFTESMALKISEYEHNEYYVLAYNTRLKTLASKNFNKRL